MTRRLLPLLLMGVVVLAGLVVADEQPGGKEDAPGLRLKRKKRTDAPPAAEPGKKDGEKAPEKPKPKAEEKAKEDEPLVPEDGPPEGEDEKEVLERIARNMRGVEEKLGNRELGEPTAQQQRDVLKDLDSLINKSEAQQQQQQSGGGGGGEQQQQQDQGGQQGKQSAQQRSSRGGSSGQRSTARNGSSKGRRQTRGSGRGERGERARGGASGSQSGDMMAKQQGGSPGPSPKGGMGGTNPESIRDVDTAMTKDVWGHLPESLRAEMNAYSNPQPFMARYDKLIREYYKTIAEQGRKKGD